MIPPHFLISGEVGAGFSNIYPNSLRRDDGEDLQHQNRLGANRQFGYVYRRGKRVSCKDLTLLYVRSTQKRVGFSVSKKVGVAVVRNRTKRRLRECVRPLLPDMKNGLYVIVARPSAAECTFLELYANVKALLKKLETAKPTGEGMGVKRA